MLRGDPGHCAGGRAVVLFCNHVGPAGTKIRNQSLLTEPPPSLLLFVIFFPRATPATASPANPAKGPEHPSFRAALIVAATCVIHAVVVLFISIFFIAAQPSHLQGWANFLGIFSTVLASIQYFPQIYTTYTLKRVGSLSIPMMCIQTPGSFLWARSLAARLGKEGWSAWGIYIVTGCLQGLLLTMAIYYELQERRQRRPIENGRPEQAANGTIDHDGESIPSEQTPLLRPKR